MSTLSRAYEYGRIVSVDLIPLGGSLAADAAAAATSITVEDASDFDENGGSLLLNGVAYTYTAWTEDDATGVGTIALSTGLAGAAVEGDMVAVYDTQYRTASTYKQAEVAVTGDDGNVDTLPASIADHLVDKIDEGIRGTTGESVKLELDGDEWVIVDVLGLGDPAAAGMLGHNTDTHTVAATGTQTFFLSHEPIAGTEHFRWGGLDLLPSEWTRAGKIVTIATPNYAEVGDVYSAAYFYRGGGPQAAEFMGASSAAGAQDATSVNIPIPAHEPGDILLLFAARGNDMGTLAGWDLVASKTPSITYTSTLYCFTKIGDGALSSVTVSTGDTDPGDVNVGGVCVAYKGTLTPSTTSELVPATSSSVFTAPTAGGTPIINVVAALYDGVSGYGSGGEVIAVSMSGATRTNLNCGSGNWSLAVAEGSGTFTDTAADSDAHMWVGIAVGIA